MKFAIATILTLALTVGSQCSVLPLGLHTEIAGGHLAYTAVSGPALAPILAPGSIAIQATNPWASAWPGSGAVVVHPAAQVLVSPSVEGSYVAKTRGALHTAPLVGHATSAAAINVAPAPGTV